VWANFQEAKIYGEKFKELKSGEHSEDSDEDRPKHSSQPVPVESDPADLPEDLFKK
jgi:hypothetical protein